MIEVLVRNAHGNLEQADRDYAAKKLGKLNRYFNAASKVEIAHTEERLGHKVEVTVFADGIALHGSETDEHVRAAIDKVTDKLETRLRRLKSRLVKRHRHKGEQIPMGLSDGEEPALQDDSGHIAEHRHYSLKPMTLEEAILQLYLTEYGFFVFKNIETSQVEAVFNREKGGYGLVTPGR